MGEWRCSGGQRKQGGTTGVTLVPAGMGAFLFGLRGASTTGTAIERCGCHVFSFRGGIWVHSTSLEQIREQALVDLTGASTTAALEAWEDRYLGRKGETARCARAQGQLPSGEPLPAFGQRVNEINGSSCRPMRRGAERPATRSSETRLATEAIDVTLPGRPVTPGHPQPPPRRCVSFMRSLARWASKSMRHVDVELEAYNFDLLNIPEYHPARDMWDTFWVKETGEGPSNRRLSDAHVTRADTGDA